MSWYSLLAFIKFLGPQDFINRRGLLIQGGDYICIHIYIYIYIYIYIIIIIIYTYIHIYIIYTYSIYTFINNIVPQAPEVPEPPTMALAARPAHVLVIVI